nr:hypothetical protein [Propionibacterium sp.]
MAAADPRHRPWASVLALSVGALVTATTGWLLWDHLGTPPLAIPWPDASLAVVLVVATGVLLWSHWMRHRGETLRPQFGIGVAAGLAVVLGLASYAPCATPDQWPVVLIGLLNLFTGQVESSLIGEAPALCRTHPLVFQLARLFGLATLLFSALAVLATLVRPVLDRLRARFARVVDVVVGLDATTLPLVRALCAERDAHVGRPDWYTPRLRWGDRPWANPRPVVVVVHHDDADPLAAEARVFGALVYVAAPTDTDALRPVVFFRPVLFWPWRVAAHRLYAVTASQRDNIAIVEHVQQMIAARHPSTDTGWLARRAVPRLVARFSDTRDARDWRLANVSSVGCLVDAITPDGLLARALVDRVAAYEATDLLITGDTPLTVAILDQVAQQRAFRHELQTKRRLEPGRRSTPEEDALNEVYQLGFDKVTILADTAADLCDEWRADRAPGAAVPTLLEPTPSTAGWKEAVGRAAARGGRPVLIVTDMVCPRSAPAPCGSATSTPTCSCCGPPTTCRASNRSRVRTPTTAPAASSGSGRPSSWTTGLPTTPGPSWPANNTSATAAAEGCPRRTCRPPAGSGNAARAVCPTSSGRTPCGSTGIC